MPPIEPNRRPIRSRDSLWARTISQKLAHAGLKPNQISVASAVFAGISGLSFAAAGRVGGESSVWLLLLAAACIQLRLLCNLFDGMVAIEGGFRTKGGEIYNEFPDRFADAFILIGAGYASSWVWWSEELGWAAAILAVITAYIRALGVAAGASQQFCGPMAKQQRMAVMTIAAVISAVEVAVGSPHRANQVRALPVALIAVILGCVVTIVRRTVRTMRELNSK
jgi:phosphatidylglycerophosphate synthase